MNTRLNPDSDQNTTLTRDNERAVFAAQMQARTIKTKYFSGAVELKGCYPLKRAIVRAAFPVGTIKKLDDFSLLVGTVSGKYDTTSFLPVTRIIHHDENGSGHKCDSRCRCAKGGNCECSCGGEFHGIDRA